MRTLGVRGSARVLLAGDGSDGRGIGTGLAAASVIEAVAAILQSAARRSTA